MDQILRAFVATVDDVDASDRTVVAKISTGDIDRHRTIIASAGVKFENYRKNPIVLFEHGKSLNRGTLPIGRNVWIKSDGKGTGRIIAKTQFARDDFADALFSFYKDGTMRGWSISALPEEASVPSREEIRSRVELKDCDLIYRSADLLEYSAVSVPSCASALSDPELRSLSTLVVRGFWTPPDELKPFVAPVVERMTESGGMASGGALIDDDDDDDDGDGDETPRKKKNAAEAERSAGEADAIEATAADAVTHSIEDAGTVDADVEAGDVVTRDAPAEQAPAEAVEAVERSDPATEDATTRDGSDLWAVFRVLSRDYGVTPDQFRDMTALAGPATAHEADPAVEPTTAVEPDPVDPLAGLPPIAGRSLEDVSLYIARRADAWRESIKSMFDELERYHRGEV